MPSRVRLLGAAAQEFAARGFDGAKVDRIARRARVNKAMLYYHFKSKADLYREILHELFQGVAQAVTRVRAGGGDAEGQVRNFIAAIADEALTRPHFPAIWLREIADGGRHLDDRIIADLRTVILALAAMLHDGRLAGRFREVPPFLTHLTIVAPLLLFTASAPIRERFAKSLPRRVARLPRDTALRFVQDATVAMLLKTGDHE
jgi:TetR/AcrR family transcriptional regulator